MRFLLHPNLKINEDNMAEYNAFHCEVWLTDTAFVNNDIDKQSRAKRDDDGNFVVNKQGEPVIETITSVVEAAPPKGWRESGYDHVYEKVEPVYNPDYSIGNYWTMTSGNVISTNGIENIGGLRCIRKIKSTLYCVEFDDVNGLRPFVDYLVKYDLYPEDAPHPAWHWIDNDEFCVILWQGWIEDDYC